MSTNNIVDFAVIGAGMAGASIAYELSKQGASVIVLETEAHAAYHTTGRSAAFYSTAYGNDTVRKITLASYDFYQNPPTGFCEHPMLKDFGALYIANKHQLDSLHKLYHQVHPRVQNVELVERDFVLSKVPQLKSDYVNAGLWEPDSKEIDVATLLMGYIKSAKNHGCEFFFNRCVSSLSYKKNHWFIQADQQHYQAKNIINAAGAWSDKIAQLAGAKTVGLIPKQRNICIAKSPDDLEANRWPLVLDVDDTFYFKPDGGNILITPADEIPVEPIDAFPDDECIAVGIERFQQAMNVEIKHLIRKWAGLRSFVADRSPVVGPDPHVKGLFWLAGQGGYGIQMAPALARIGASLALDNRIPEDLESLGLELDSITPTRCYTD